MGYSLDAITGASQMTEWISVKDKLPESETDVLMIDIDGWMVTCHFQIRKGGCNRWNSGHCCGREPREPSHWMPLPKPPAPPK